MNVPIELVKLGAASFVLGLTGALMPGPLLALTVSETPRRGAMAGPLLVLGHGILEAALVVAIALGLAAFLRGPIVIALIGLIGGLVLVWMGQGMMRAAGGMSFLPTAGQPVRTLHPIAGGMLASLANPYWSFWWATIGSAYLLRALNVGVAGVIAFFAGHILADLIWYAAISTGLAKGARLMSDRAYQRLVSVGGATLIGFGGWFLYRGVTGIAG